MNPGTMISAGGQVNHSYTAMEATFDQNNRWHVQAALFVMFLCETSSCRGYLSTNDLPEKQRSGDDLYIDLAQLAQARGWTCIGDLQFLCPQCSATRLAV